MNPLSLQSATSVFIVSVALFITLLWDEHFRALNYCLFRWCNFRPNHRLFPAILGVVMLLLIWHNVALPLFCYIFFTICTYYTLIFLALIIYWFYRNIAIKMWTHNLSIFFFQQSYRHILFWLGHAELISNEFLSNQAKLKQSETIFAAKYLIGDYGRYYTPSSLSWPESQPPPF